MISGPEVIDTGICDRFVELLEHPNTSVQVPALRTVGNLVTGNDDQTDAVLACEPLRAVTTLMGSTKMLGGARFGPHPP